MGYEPFHFCRGRKIGKIVKGKSVVIADGAGKGAARAASRKLIINQLLVEKKLTYDYEVLNILKSFLSQLGFLHNQEKS